MKKGEGTLYLSNGEYFRGEFDQDLPNGRGAYRNINGSTIKGHWVNGVLQEL